MPGFVPQETPIIILAEGCFGAHTSKTATGVIRYGQWPIVAVIDSTQAGKTVEEVTEIPCLAPIVASLAEALSLGAMQPKALLLGTAPQGGQLPDAWQQILRAALSSGLHLINGLHTFLANDPTWQRLAAESGVTIWDVRTAPEASCVAQQQRRTGLGKVIPFVGSDCSVGKMCSALELTKAAHQAGIEARFVATGQTGMMIAGDGIPLDRIIGDFMAGHMEQAVLNAVAQPKKPALVFVEGQGSLLHPGYSAVTLALLHGSHPDGLILCHDASLKALRGYEIEIPPMTELIALYEQVANAPRRKLIREGNPQTRVLGLSINTSRLSEADARQYLRGVAEETHLPVTDPIRYGVDTLLAECQTLL